MLNNGRKLAHAATHRLVPARSRAGTCGQARRLGGRGCERRRHGHLDARARFPAVEFHAALDLRPASLHSLNFTGLFQINNLKFNEHKICALAHRFKLGEDRRASNRTLPWDLKKRSDSD